MPTCKLCQRTVPKLIRCHIYPDAMTPSLAEDGPVIHIATSRDAAHLGYSNNGLFDREIVCADCERLFQHGDNHGTAFRKAVLALDGLLRYYDAEPELPIFRADPEALHTFAMQTLLRAHLSQRRECKAIHNDAIAAEVYAHLKAGTSTLETGRQVIYCFGRSAIDAVMMSPMFKNIPGWPCYQLTMPHMVIYIAGSASGLPDPMPSFALQPGNEVLVWRRRRLEGFDPAVIMKVLGDNSERIDRLLGR